jgi:hypothetical protein
MLRHQQTGDEESAEDEEQIHTEEPARSHLRGEVRQDHQKHGKTTKPVKGA